MTPIVGVLRPEPGNAATTRRLVAAGLRPVSLPLFATRAVAWSPPDAWHYDALVLTSAAVFRHGGAALARYRHLPAIAVGEATAEAARAAGWRVVQVGRSGAADLAVPPRALHLTGVDHRPIPGATAVPVYESVALAGVDLAPLSGGIALLHSPRAAARFAALVANPAAIAVVAISAAALCAAGPGWRTAVHAVSPDDEAMIDACRALIDAGPPRADNPRR